MKIQFYFLLLLAATTVQAQVSLIGESPKLFSVNLGECRFKVADPFNGRLRAHTDEKPPSASYYGPLYQSSLANNDLWIQMWCKPASKVDRALCGLDLENGEIITTGLEGFSEEEKRQIKNDLHQTLFVLNGKNWKGAGVQADQISGDENLRSRFFNFCIPHNDRIIEGRVESAAQLNNLKESAMPNIIKLLEGIEFVDDAEAPIHAPASPH